MADVTISKTDRGVFEIALAAATPQEVIVNYSGNRQVVKVACDSGTKPVYVGRATLAAKARTAVAQVPVGGVVQLNVAQGDSIWLVSEAIGTYSVFKA